MEYDLGTLQKYRTNTKNVNVLRQPLYDHLLYPAAGIAQLIFFALPQGQGVTTALGAAVGSAKTIADTNMEQAGALPRPKYNVVESIEVTFAPGSSAAANTYLPAPTNAFAAVAAAAVLAAVADTQTFYESGSLELFIGSTAILNDAPLGRFPSKTHFAIDAAVATNSATTAEVAAITSRAAGRPYYVDPIIVLETLQNFAVNVRWPGAVALPSGFNARVGVRLDGVQYRQGQ